jgi:predicted ATPase
MIEKQLDQLTAEKRRILEGASVAGVEFSAAAVAAGLEAEPVFLEEQCEELARREHFQQSKGATTWPDGTVTTRYGFRHALYHDAVMSLSRLWQRQGKKDEARQLLAEVYSWFTEGFATADLQEAKALLIELA